jgi:hypothetical protein
LKRRDGVLSTFCLVVSSIFLAGTTKRLSLGVVLWSKSKSKTSVGFILPVLLIFLGVDVVHHKITSVTKSFRTLFLLELTEEVTSRQFCLIL